jgi:putative NIF3 family GTP cyclohydrolase 1 type 2
MNKILNGTGYLYINEHYEYCWLVSNNYFDDTIFLNDTVEIIEEQEEIDIQSIEEIEPPMNGNACVIDNKTWTLNQVIKAVKQLDKKIKEK